MTRRGRRRLLIVLGALVLLAGVAIGAVALRNVQRARLAAEARAQGLAAHAEGDYRTALDRLGYALSQNREDVSGLMAFADSRAHVFQVNRQHLTAAAKAYRAVLKLQPDHVPAMERLLGLYEQLGYDVELIRTADRLLDVDADHISALRAKVGALWRQRRLDEAMDLARALAQREPRALKWRALQLEILAARDASVAERTALCDSWIDAEPDWPGFRVLKAQMLAEVGAFDAAREELAQAADRPPADRAVLAAMLDLCRALDLPEQAARLVADAKQHHPDAAWVYDAALRRHWQNLHLERGMSELDAAAEVFDPMPLSLLRWHVMFQLLAASPQQAGQAVAAYQRAAERLPRDERQDEAAWAAALRARINLDRRPWRETIAAYEQALALLPRDPMLIYLVAEAHQRVGEHERALALLDRASADDAWLLCRMLRVEALLGAGRYSEAFTLARSLAADSDAGGRAHLLLARTWWAMGDAASSFRITDEATGRSYDLPAFLRLLHERLPHNAEVAMMFAEEALRTGDAQAFGRVVDHYVAQRPIPHQELITLARLSAAYDAGAEDRIREAVAIHSDASTAAMRLDVALLQEAGRSAEALQRLEAHRAEQPQPLAAMPEALYDLRLDLLLSVGDEAALADLRQQVDARPPDVEQTYRILARDAAWQDATLIETLLEHLRRQVGPGMPRVLLAEALALHRFHDGDRAAAARAMLLTRRVLEMTPDSPSALSLLATLYVQDDQPQTGEAVDALRRALDARPQALALYPRLIALLQHEGRYAEAQEYLNRFGRRIRDDRDLQHAALKLLAAQGQFEEAAMRLTRMDWRGAEERELLTMALIYSRGGHPDKAEVLFEQLLASDEPSVDAVRQAAHFYANTGREAEALNVLRTHAGALPGAEGPLLLGGYLLERDRPDDAQPHLERAVDIDPDRVESWVLLMQCHLKAGDLHAAQQAAQRGLELDPDHQSLKIGLAATGLCLGSDAPESTVAMLERLGEENPALLEMLLAFDRVSRMRRDEAPTEDDLQLTRRLVKQYPHHAAAWRVAVEGHRRAGEYVRAGSLARDAVSRFPTDARFAEQATALFVEAGRLHEALEMAGQWRRRTLHDPLEADVASAEIHLRLGRPQPALEHLRPHAEQIWAQREHAPERLKTWLSAHLAADDLDRVASSAPQLFEESPAWRTAWLRIASESPPAVARDALRVVEPHLTEAPSEQLALAAAWNRLGRRTGDARDLSRAATVAQGVLDDLAADAPLWTDATLLRAAVASASRDFSLARSLYRDVLSRDGTNLVALNNLADVLARTGTDCDEACALATRAVEQAPQDPHALDTLAQALLCAGRMDEALRRAREAVEHAPADAFFHFTLARVHHERGEPARCRAALDQAEAEAKASRPLNERLIQDINTMRRELNQQEADRRESPADVAAPVDVS